jgi:hypothetical protein
MGIEFLLSRISSPAYEIVLCLLPISTVTYLMRPLSWSSRAFLFASYSRLVKIFFLSASTFVSC